MEPIYSGVLNARLGFCLSRDTHTDRQTDFPEDYFNPRRLGLIITGSTLPTELHKMRTWWMG